MSFLLLLGFRVLSIALGRGGLRPSELLGIPNNPEARQGGAEASQIDN